MAESDWDNTVAQAAPATPKPNFKIKSKSKATFNPAPMEGHNEQKVQPDIEDGGKQQEQKRGSSITYCT